MTTVRKLANDLSEPLPQPSAMFKGIEVVALLSCEVKPYCSS